MSCNSRSRHLLWLLLLLVISSNVAALESDRQQPLEVKADSTDGTLGDGVTTLRGNIEIRQGSLLIRADVAEVDKAQGKVKQVTLTGNTAYLEQEVEEQGLVKAWAERIDYQVANGMVEFTGKAEVQHPQYEISGDVLRYDLAAQHFEGAGDATGEGRIRIRLDPEVLDEGGRDEPPPEEDGQAEDDPQTSVMNSDAAR